MALREKATKLEGRNIMGAYAETAYDNELASEELLSLVGFLDERFRKHVYLRGWLNAIIVLNPIIRSYPDPAFCPEYQ